MHEGAIVTVSTLRGGQLKIGSLCNQFTICIIIIIIISFLKFNPHDFQGGGGLNEPWHGKYFQQSCVEWTLLLTCMCIAIIVFVSHAVGFTCMEIYALQEHSYH